MELTLLLVVEVNSTCAMSTCPSLQAGFLLTKGLDLVEDTPQLKGWIVSAAIGLAVTLALSALVQWCVGTFREATQTIKALYQHQRLRLIVVPETVRAIMSTPESRYKLTSQLLEGAFISEDLLDRWQSPHRRGMRARLAYGIAIWMQWILVAVCYVVVLIVAFR